MGFINKTWTNPVTLDASNLNRLEQGLKNSYDNLEILNEEVANLQTKRINIEAEISKLIKQDLNLAQELTKIIPSNTHIPSSNYLSTLEQVLTQEELKQVYSNLKLNNFLKLSDIRVNGTSIVTDSILNISVPIIDQKVNANSTNAISNKAVAEILANFNPDIKVPTKLSELEQDGNHMTVTATEKAKWNAGGNGISKETDPTVPAWAKEPVKPFYAYSEIIGTPTKLSVFTNDMDFTTTAYVDSEITKLNNILLGPDGDAALDTITELASAIADNSDIINTLNQAITNKAAKDHTHTESEITDLKEYSLKSHTHIKSEITDFAHTHTKADITDFNHTHDYSPSTHTHGLLNKTFGSTITNTTTDSGWSMIDSSMSASGSHNGFLIKALRSGVNAPNWMLNDYAAGIAFGGGDTKGIISVAYSTPKIKFSGGNGSKPVWNITLKGTSGTTYDLSTLASSTHTHAITDLKNSAGNTFTSAKVMTSRSHSGWTNNAADDRIIPTMSVLAYWNGAYNASGSSNLTRCIKGDIVGTTGAQTIGGNKTFTGTTSTMDIHCYSALKVINGSNNSLVWNIITDTNGNLVFTCS